MLFPALSYQKIVGLLNVALFCFSLPVFLSKKESFTIWKKDHLIWLLV